MSILAIFLFSISAFSGIPLTFGSTKFISGGCKICGRLLAICRAVVSFVTLLSSIVFIFLSSCKSEMSYYFHLYYYSIEYLEHKQR
jgi:hypothetical protein